MSTAMKARGNTNGTFYAEEEQSTGFIVVQRRLLARGFILESALNSRRLLFLVHPRPLSCHQSLFFSLSPNGLGEQRG